MGELHLDIIVDRLRREFKVEVNQGQPQVEYKEAITKVAITEKFTKTIWWSVNFDIVFTLEPAEEGKVGLEFINAVKVVTCQKNLFLLLKKVSTSNGQWATCRF